LTRSPTTWETDALTEKDFNDVVRDGVTLVDFNAPWCAPCHAQLPILSRIAQQFQARASVISLNIDDYRRTAQDYGIRNIPTLIIFRNGKEIQRFVGLQSEAVLSRALEGIVD